MSDDGYKAAKTPPEYLAGAASVRASFDGERSLLNAANRELAGLLAEALDLCVRARALVDPSSAPWAHDLAVWEIKTRGALGVIWETKAMTNIRTLSGAEFQRAVGTDVDKWADAAMVAAEDLGFKIDRDWIRSLLADAMEAAREGSIREVIRPAAST